MVVKRREANRDFDSTQCEAVMNNQTALLWDCANQICPQFASSFTSILLTPHRVVSAPRTLHKIQQISRNYKPKANVGIP